VKTAARQDRMDEAQVASRPAGGCLTCGHCGYTLQSLAVRCPRCTAPLSLGCDGNCRECGAHSS